MSTTSITLRLNGIWKRTMRTNNGVVVRHLFALDVYLAHGRLAVSALFRESTRNGKVVKTTGGSTAISLSHLTATYTRLPRAPRGMGRCKKVAVFAPNMS